MKKLLTAIAIATALMFSACDDVEYDLYTTVAGMVVDEQTSEPIEGATVNLSPSGKSSTTGSDGTFEFPDLDAQQYTLLVQKPGYTTNRKSVTGVAGETVSVSIILHKAEE